MQLSIVDRIEGWRNQVDQYGAYVLSASVVAVLMLHPLMVCFDCEFPGTEGKRGDGAVFACYLLAPCLAGLLKPRNGWIVPVAAVAAMIGTQPLAGLPWWSLRESEGPLILIFDSPLVAGTYLAGRGIHAVALLLIR